MRLTFKILEQILDWTAKGNIGVSSNTILFSITGKSVYGSSRDTPCDYSDFNRCMELLSAVPSLKRHLKVVGEKYPKWIPLLKNWKRLEKAYIERDGFGEYLYSLRDECYLADGYEKTTCGWTKVQKSILFTGK